LLTPDAVLRGAAEIRTGQAFCLSLPLDLPGGMVLNPNRKPPFISPVTDGSGPRYNRAWAEIDPRFVDVSSDDLVELTLQYSTQWDGLAHVGAFFDVDGLGVKSPVYYNGFRAGTDVQAPSDREALGLNGSFAQKLAVDNFAVKPVQGRGVLIDLLHHLGSAPQRVRFAAIEEIMRLDGIEVCEGDIVLLRTGFADRIIESTSGGDPMDLNNSCAVLDGSDQSTLEWITDCGLVALVADNYAVETPDIPRGPELQSGLPIHHLCLFKLGVVLGELWYLGELAQWLRAHGRNHCLITAPPLRLPGAVGSPANPVATV
jgi:kynurenine formamidase